MQIIKHYLYKKQKTILRILFWQNSNFMTNKNKSTENKFRALIFTEHQIHKEQRHLLIYHRHISLQKDNEFLFWQT